MNPNVLINSLKCEYSENSVVLLMNHQRFLYKKRMLLEESLLHKGKNLVYIKYI